MALAFLSPPSLHPYRYQRYWSLDIWWWLVLALAAFTALPIVTVIFLALKGDLGLLHHLAQTVLGRYLRDSLLLTLGSGLGALFIGTIAAWLSVMCRFPGRRFFSFALLLPMAVPAYVVAYTVVDLTDYAGPIQSALRSFFGWQSAQDYWFFKMRSLAGGIILFTLVLYPYVYLLARAAFLEQSVCVLEVARTLGKGPWRCFFTVALPLARPALAAGGALVAMEVLNDFGTVRHLAIDTLSVGIYRLWLGMGDSGAAAQLAIPLLAFVLLCLALEKTSRRSKGFYSTQTKLRPLPAYRLSPLWAFCAMSFCMSITAFGFFFPALTLAYWIIDAHQAFNKDFWHAAGYSLLLASLGAVLTVILGLCLAYAARLSKSPTLRFLVKFSVVGYAIPGSILALGILIPFSLFDLGASRLIGWLWDGPAGLWLSGSLVAILAAYAVRFAALAHGTVDASLTRITLTMEGAARSLGYGPWASLQRVHLPLMRGSVLTAALLVFVDIMKELPATLMLRPFNVDTLAIHAYHMAADERLQECAPAALAIMVVGLLPVFLLSRAIGQSRISGSL
jgi:iron(III) transport system permease protein